MKVLQLARHRNENPYLKLVRFLAKYQHNHLNLSENDFRDLCSIFKTPLYLLNPKQPGLCGGVFSEK
jgi:hypothetical protein